MSSCECRCKDSESELSVPITNIASLINALTTNTAFAAAVIAIVGSPPALDYANFDALMPNDNPLPIAVGAPIEFPNIGPARAGTGITALNTTTFQLAAVGDYEIKYQASITEDGQLCVMVNGVIDPESVAGRSGLFTQISNCYTLRTTSANTVISVNNPAGNPTVLTLTPFAGNGIHPVSAQLQITRLA